MQTSDINPLVRRSALRCLASNLLVRRSALRCLVRVAGLPLAVGRPHEALDVGPRVVELEADVEPHVGGDADDGVDEARRRSTSDLGSWSSKPTSSRTSAGMPTTASTRPVAKRSFGVRRCAASSGSQAAARCGASARGARAAARCGASARGA